MCSKIFFMILILSLFLSPCVAIDMVLVEGGTFVMGDPEKSEEHQVTLDSFYIGQYEVTYKDLTGYVKKYTDGTEDPAFLEELDPDYLNKGDYPVVRISRKQAAMICNWLSEKEGLEPVYELNGGAHWENNGYRLPTDAEWEFAARGGTLSRGYEYPGSDTVDEVAWYTFNSKPHTHPVGQKKPNELGIYDMGGNVWERCDNLWKKYTGEDEVNPRGENVGDRDTDPEGFVLRGGSFANMPQYIRSVFRTYDEHGIDVSIGFRVCRRAEDS